MRIPFMQGCLPEKSGALINGMHKIIQREWLEILQMKRADNKLNRFPPLDWLRGTMALSVMVYHFANYHEAAHLLGRLGIYAVSIFFILSGLSMAIAYDLYIRDIRTSLYFFIRRLFRIWPLLWLSIALVVIPTNFLGYRFYGHDEPYSLAKILLNVSTLFGFVAPGQYINVGAWSIGNEMVYYAFTPGLIAAYKWRKQAGNLMTLLAAGIGLLFASRMLTTSSTLADQWMTYINPFNNLFLYCAGLAIYYNFRDLEIPQRFHLPLFMLPVILFAIYPANGDQINLVTGFNRVAFSIISIVVVFAFYKCAPVLPKFIGDKFEQLGIATYGIYLLHPIILEFTRSAFRALGLQIKYLPTLAAIGLTIALSLLIYKLLEAPLINLGKKLTKSRTTSFVMPQSGCIK